MNLPSFVATILDRPDDDGPRLVLADWLDEIGDPRGEQLRRPGRWVLVQRWHWYTPKAREMHDAKREFVSVLLWDDVTGSGPAAVIGMVTPVIMCKNTRKIHPRAFDLGATTRVAGQWLCWSCATAVSQERTIHHVKNLTDTQIQALMEGIVARPVDAG